MDGLEPVGTVTDLDLSEQLKESIVGSRQFGTAERSTPLLNSDEAREIYILCARQSPKVGCCHLNRIGRVPLDDRQQLLGDLPVAGDLC